MQMMTDRFFVYPTDRASKDYSYYVKKYIVYRYELVFSGRKSFLDILHKENPQDAASSLLGKFTHNAKLAKVLWTLSLQ